MNLEMLPVLWLWMLPNDFTPYLSFSLSSCLSSERHAAFATHSWISLLLNMDQQTKTSVKGYKGNCWRESTNTRAWILYTYTQAETGKSHGPVQLTALQLWKTNELLHIWSSPCVEKLSLWATHTHTYTYITNTSTPHTHVFFIAQLTIWLES